MPSLLSLLGILRWPATVTAAIFVFAMATQASLSLLADNFSRRPATHATIKAGMATPVIRVPDTPAMSPATVRARVTVIPDGRRYALAATGSQAAATPDHGPARMVASTGLIVRSQPRKASAALGSIPRGATVEVRSRQSGWLLIKGPGATTGWVYGKYLTPAADG